MSSERAAPAPGHQGAAPAPGQGTILEDDQQLYDWGIENRLDQYTYQVGYKQLCKKSVQRTKAI